MIRYFFFDNMISNGIKYEIGKWYRLPLKYDDNKHKNINNLLLKNNNDFNFRLSSSDQPICSNIYEVNVNKKDNSFKILKEINYNQSFSDFKYIEYKYYNACLLAAIKKNDKRFLKYRKKERIINHYNYKILDIMTDKELFNLYKMGGSVTKSYILNKGIKKIILLNYYEDFSSLPLNLFPNLFPNIGYKGLSQIQNKHKGEILISDNEQFLNENFNDYQKNINLSYLSFKNFISIGRKKDIDFLKDKKLDSSKAELLVQNIYDLKYLKEIEKSKISKISCIAEYSIIKNDLDRKNISFVYYFQIDKSKILKIRYSDFLREVDFNVFSKNKNKLNKINFIGFDDGNDFVIDFYKKWGLRFEPKLDDNEYVDLLNDIKQLKTKYNYLYDNDFCDFDYSEEDLKYLLKKELKSNNI